MNTFLENWLRFNGTALYFNGGLSFFMNKKSYRYIIIIIVVVITIVLIITIIIIIIIIMFDKRHGVSN